MGATTLAQSRWGGRRPEPGAAAREAPGDGAAAARDAPGDGAGAARAAAGDGAAAAAAGSREAGPVPREPAQSDRPVPSKQLLFYFEATVLDQGELGKIGVGFTPKDVKLTRQPG
jgi:hypothetical protein